MTSPAPQWTSPPEEPSPYRLRDRLSDMFHGWRDGKARIPELPPAQGEPAELVESPIEAPDMRQALTMDGEYAPEAEVLISTPRIVVLGSEALEAIAREALLLEVSCAPLKDRLKAALAEQDRLPEEIRLAAETLAKAQVPLTPQELARRRSAEEDGCARPDSLIVNRRLGEHSRRLGGAESRYLALKERLAEATRTAEALEEIIEHRRAAAQAAARRDHERGQRRIATYLQLLVRSHPDGPYLNLLIHRQPVGPELPEWVREPTTTGGDA